MLFWNNKQDKDKEAQFTSIEQKKECNVCTSDGTLTITLVSIEIGVNSNCNVVCPNDTECSFIKNIMNGSLSTNFVHNAITIDIINESEKPINIDIDRFKVVDVNGMTHGSVKLCDKFSMGLSSKDTKIFPKTVTRFRILFQHFEENISLLLYGYPYGDEYISLFISETNRNTSKDDAHQIVVQNLETEILNLKKELASALKDYEDMKIKYYEEREKVLEAKSIDPNKSFKQRMMEDNLVKYRIVEDDDYWRIFSCEVYDTISFNREFDKSKENYNWINVGDPLVTLKVDNVGYGLNAPTIVKSPVAGVFEFNSNKIIRFDEEICRIRKYEQSEKESVIAELEKEDIKQNIYKKERKKMIERETLDELIEEGKVFNVYTKKQGNRTTIPMDIATAVWNRDGGKCCFCGSREELEFDHIIPLSKGGATSFRNLQLLCKSCNIKKSDNI